MKHVIKDCYEEVGKMKGGLFGKAREKGDKRVH